MKIILLSLLLMVTCHGVAYASNAVDRLRYWAYQSVNKELQSQQPNLNQLASFSLPFVTDIQRTRNGYSYSMLRQLSWRLQQMPKNRMECRNLADIHLISGFLKRVNLGFDTSQFASKLRDCVKSESIFDLSNALVFYCGHSSDDHEERLPGGLQRLLDAQQPDGSYLMDDGEPWFYLASHALLAMHHCKADKENINKTRDYIEKLLPEYHKTGFTDGMAEALIFLRWTGAAAKDEEKYLEYLRARIDSQGGVCFQYKKDCEEHWHPVSLLMQLFLEVDFPEK